MEQGLIYDPTAKDRIADLLKEQGKQFSNIDKNEENTNKKVVRITIIFVSSVAIIVGLKFLTKKRK